MSEIDVRLDWKEEATERVREDRFVPDAPDGPAETVVTVQRLDGEAAASDASEEEVFEYSEHRAAALERALGRLQGVRRPPVLRTLAELMSCAELPDFPGRLDAAEAWIASRLHEWQEVRSVEPEDESEEAREQAELFNRSLSAGSDALTLCLEIVGLLRSGEFALIERLLEQVENSLTEARETLVAVGE